MRTATIHSLFAIALLCGVQAATVQVQFQQSAAANDQAGWVQDIGGSPPINGSSTEYGGFTYVATGTHTRSHSHHVDYKLVDHTDGDLDNLLSGGVLTNASTTNVTLSLTGLADGDYSITTYHHTPYARPDGFTNGFDFDLLLNTGGGNSVIHDDVPISFGASVDNATLASFVTPFTISGGATATLTFQPGAGYQNGGDHLNINGFELTQIPEPSAFAFAFLGLGGLALLRRRRN